VLVATVSGVRGATLMTTESLHERASEAAAVIREQVPVFPEIAVVLGSGLGALAENLENRATVPYARIPHFPRPTVAGHAGNLVVGSTGAARLAALQGRFHYYEGHSLETVTFPIRVLQVLGVKTLVLTAATGGIRPALRPGTLLCLSDHLNLLGFNPLRGTNDDRFGPRFPDMTEVYSARLRTLARDEAIRLGVTLEEGVYACLPGPSYETPAEIRMLGTLGADVVGMSTVPEAIVARHAGIEVLAFAVVSNWAAGIAAAPISHEEVLAAGREAGPRLGRLISGVAVRIANGS
jgi:purine-nucleoside phosphorylase